MHPAMLKASIESFLIYCKTLFIVVGCSSHKLVMTSYTQSYHFIHSLKIMDESVLHPWPGLRTI